MTAKEALDHAWMKGQSVGGLDHKLSEDGEDHLVQHMKEYRKYSDLKRAALLAISFTLGETTIQTLRDAFQEMDKDHTGVISHKEFNDILHKHGVMDDAECNRIFDSIDQDHHGVIKYTEFLAACVDESVYLEDKRVVEAFNRLDVDHTGKITKENLKTLLGDDVTSAALDRMIAEADFHHDGMINLDEFRRMMKGETATSEEVKEG